MKVLGIILVVFGVLNLIVAIIAGSMGDASVVASKIGGACMLGVLGAFLISRANKKKEEASKKEKWENETKE